MKLLQKIFHLHRWELSLQTYHHKHDLALCMIMECSNPLLSNGKKLSVFRNNDGDVTVGYWKCRCGAVKSASVEELREEITR